MLCVLFFHFSAKGHITCGISECMLCVTVTNYYNQVLISIPSIYQASPLTYDAATLARRGAGGTSSLKHLRGKEIAR